MADKKLSPKEKKRQKWKEGNKNAAKPDDYLNDIFNKLIEHLESGFTMPTFPHAAQSSLYNWFNTRRDIFDSERIELAKQRGRFLLERLAIGIMTGKQSGSGRMAMFFLASRCDYTLAKPKEDEEKDRLVAGSENLAPIIRILPVKSLSDLRHTDKYDVIEAEPVEPDTDDA